MSKDSKAILKEAHEFIIQKEYNTAIKICKRVLKTDKNNYNAFVLMGAAMRQVEDLKTQVPVTLKKAIKLKPDNPLAWHGLMTYYEELESSAEILTELVPVYNKVLQLENVSSKFPLYLKSLSTAVLKLNDNVMLSDSIKVLLKLKDEAVSNQEAVNMINDILVSTLTQYQNIPTEFDEVLEKILSSVIENESSINRYDYYKKYLKLLYKSEKFDKLIFEAVKMHNIFKQDIYALEWICRVYSQLCITHNTFKEEIDFVLYYETLLDHDPESIFGYFAKAVHLYQTGHLLDSRNILDHLLTAKSKWFHAWLLLSKIDTLLYCWEDVEFAATNAIKMIPDGDPHNLKSSINLILLEALIKSTDKRKWKEAETKFDELSDGSLKSSLLRARLYVLLQDTRAKELIILLQTNPETLTEATVLCSIDLLLKKQLEEAADTLGSVLGTSEAWLILGKIHWEMADYGHSLMAFLKGISADPNNWECLMYLGRYHQEQTKDYERSRKCYQKALQINPNSDQAGIGLSSIYRILKNSETNLQFLNQITNHGRGPKWALIQLGLQHLDHGNAIEAVSIFRNAVKIDPTDSNCWECLGDAYLARGAHLSALKSYERALELNSESFYSMTQLTNIKLLIGQYALGRSDYMKILERHETNLVALKGLAECCFNLGKEYAATQLLTRARENFQESVDSLTKAIMQRNNFLCFWKLLGDVCYNTALLPENYCLLRVIPRLIQSDIEDNTVIIKQKEILLLSIRCYCKALSMSKNSPLLWHDVACCYLAQVNLNTVEDKKEVINKSLEAAKEAVKLDPSSWFHWNLLGTICMTNEIKHYALAQHSFVMSIEIEPNNPISWTNLGSLYLILDDPYRANEAFSWSQKIDPAYINCWIGQALIAEKLSPKEAMDLFRHASQLGYHDEAAAGYTHWVIKTIMDPESKKDSLYTYVIEKMHAVTVASDNIQWYTVHFPHDLYALNAYGLLLERQKLFKSSAKQFLNALKEVTDSKIKDLLNINLARIMVQLEKYEDAVKICLSIKETNFASHCQLALSLFKAEHFKESYEAYDAALHWLADTASDKAHVLCAMAAMAFMFQESNDTKTLLYQSVGTKPPIISGLLALAALGMLDKDKNLTHLALKELKHHDNNPEYRNDIAKLTAYSYLIQNDMESASRVICKYLHRYPESSELWTNLARILLTMNDISFNKCITNALYLEENFSSEHIAKIKCMSSLSKLITLSPHKGLRFVLNTVHSYPANVDSWSNLITALLPRWTKISQFNAHWLLVLISRIRNSLPCSRNMEQWLLKNEKKANDIAYCEN